MSSKRIIKRTDGSRLPGRLPTGSRHVTIETDEESITASEMEDDMEIYHPVVTKKKKLMNLTHNLQTDHPRSKRAVTISVAKDDDPEFLVVRESQGREIISEHRKPKMQLTGEPSGKRSDRRETLVFMPEITKQEKPMLPETWGREDETPTQLSDSSETSYTYTSDSIEHLTPSDIKVTSSEGIDVTPMEEYIMVVERIINKGSLSPRSTEVLRKNVNRCKSILSRMKDGKTPVLDSSIDTPIDMPFPSSQKGATHLNEILSTESDHDLPIERAASIIPLESEESTKKSTSIRPVKKREKPEIPSTSRYQPSISSKESISDASGVSVTKEGDTTETDRYEIHSSVARTFKESLKDSCHLENFTIEDPFSDFSLRHLRQDKLLKERIVKSQRDDDSFVSADSGPCSDRKDSSTSTSVYYDSISCSEDFYQQPHPTASTQNNADLHTAGNFEMKRDAFRRVKLKMESIKEESTPESTDNELNTHRKFTVNEYKMEKNRVRRTASSEMSFSADDNDSFTESEYVRNLTEQYQVTQDAEESVEGLPLDNDETMNGQNIAAIVRDNTTAAGYNATVEEINDYAINSEVDLKDKVTCAVKSAEIIQDVTDDTAIVDTDASGQLEQSSKIDKGHLKGMKNLADKKTDISKRKTCAKCGMPVVKNKETTKRLVKREANIISSTLEPEVDRTVTGKKTTSTCKCGCMKTAMKNNNVEGGSHRSIVSRISNYFFPLLADFLVPRHLNTLIIEMTL